MKKKHYICKIKPPETHCLKRRASSAQTVGMTGTEKRLFQCLEIGLSHTPTIGVSHTYTFGLSHTDFEALKGAKMRCCHPPSRNSAEKGGGQLKRYTKSDIGNDGRLRTSARTYTIQHPRRTGCHSEVGG
ncbi:MAG: hypothetical protein IKQ62_03095 [Bacteroidaceae bacterium]|nr:hypothetical protein [Bacteroidaceae bacterium]